MPDLDPLKLKIEVNNSSATSKIDGFASSVKKLSSVAEQTKTPFGKLGTALKAIGGATSGAKNAFSSLKGTIGGLRISTVALTAALVKLKNGIASCVKNAMDFVETMNLFNVSMGDNAIAAGEFAEKVQQAFGIDMAEWMRNQGVFQTLIEGFGVASEKADIMSQNLTQLGYDLSSLFNIPFAESMQKLQSGIAGELEPLRRLGYDLSQAKLQQIAYDHGIQQSVATMTQAEKSQLRYYAIMTQVTTAQGDMARTIMQPANMLRVFQQNVTLAARAIGNLFIPVMQKMLAVGIIVARGIAKVANAIASIFGIKVDYKQYLDTKNYASGLSDVADKTDDVGTSSGRAAKGVRKLRKEFQKQLLGFDKINNITLPKESTSPRSSGSGGGVGGIGGGGDFDLPLPTYDFLQGVTDAFAELHPRLQMLFDDLAKDMENGGHNIGRILGYALRDGLFSIKWDNIKEAGRRAAEKLADGLNDFLETPNLFKAVGYTVAQSLNTVFNTAETFAKAFHWGSLGKAIGDSITQFFKTFDFRGAGRTLFRWASGILEATISAVKNVDWGLVGRRVAEFIAGIDWETLISQAIDLAKLVVKGVADFTISFVKNLAWEVLQWLYNTITGRNKKVLELDLNGKEDPSFKKAYKEYDETTNKKVTVDARGKERKSFITTSKDFNELDTKEVTATAKGKIDSSYKSTVKEYDKTQNKRVTTRLDGTVSQSAKDALSYQGKYKDQVKTTKVNGEVTSGAKTALEKQNAFKDRAVTATVKGDVAKSAKIAWSEYTGFKDKSVTINVKGKLDKDAKIVAKMGSFALTAQKKADGGIFKNGKWRPVTAAANGGAFNTGQMFIAREAGPELVGTIGGHTAVMNNDQIVSSVAAGVASANSTQNSLLRQLINAVQSGEQQLILQVDSTRLGEVAIRSINRVQRQAGRTLLTV